MKRFIPIALLIPLGSMAQTTVSAGATMTIEGADFRTVSLTIEGSDDANKGIVDLNAGNLYIEEASVPTADTDGDLLIDNFGELQGGNGNIFLEGDFIIDESGEFIYETSKVIFPNGPGLKAIKKETGGGAQKTIGFYRLFSEISAGVNATSDIDIQVHYLFYHSAGVFQNGGTIEFKSASPTFYAIYQREGTTGISNFGTERFECTLSNNSAGSRQISFPFQTSNNLSTLNPIGIPLLYDGQGNPGQENVRYWDATDDLQGSNFAKGWATAAGTDDKLAYSIYLENNGTHDFSTTFSVDGNAFGTSAREYTQDLYWTNDPTDDPDGDPTARRGWNFVPNPWPSMLDVNAMLVDPGFTPDYKAIHLWDANSELTKQYTAMLGNGVTIKNWNTTGGGTDIFALDPTLAPFQAFWVFTEQDQTLTLDEDVVRDTARGDANTFLKTQPDGFQLNVFTQDSAWDAVRIYFDENASDQFDNTLEARKLRSVEMNAPYFYGIEENIHAQIIARKKRITDSVTLGFTTKEKEQTYFINSDFENLDPSWYVFLYDKKEKQWFDLKESNNQEFHISETDNANRFVVHFTKNERTYTDKVQAQSSSISAFTRGDQVVIKSIGLEGNAMVSIHDITGRELYSTLTTIQKNEEKSIGLDIKQSMILVKTLINGQVYVDRLFLR
ncbi:MAG: hypothetical protein N4A46_04990 [Schleiferiaceae bacterium]|nr:hypothetical protein [Schleiferiaceae bacterium]